MAVIHISEAEVLSDPSSILEKAHAGEEIYIEGDAGPLRLTKVTTPSVSANPLTPRYTQPRMASDILADLKRRGSKATLPPGFAKDVEDGVRAHENEFLSDVWD